MKINANDQLDIKGACLSGCDRDLNYYNFRLYMFNSNQWISFPNTSYYFKTGISPQHDLTVKEDLFQDYSFQAIWKIELEVFLPKRNINGSTSIVFLVNYPPRFGFCNIDPRNGTTNTIFSISCLNWIDSDGGLDSYSYYGIKLLKYFTNLKYWTFLSIIG